MNDFTAQPPRPQPLGPTLDAPLSPPRRSLWKEQRTTVAVAAVTAAVVTVLLGIGRQGISSIASQGGSGETLRQEGTAIVRQEPLEVYYPVPYAGPPNLALIGGGATDSVIVEQKPDHFKIQIAPQRFGSWTVNWKAEGLRAPGPVPGR